MSNSPEKGEKQNVGKGEKGKQTKRTETEKMQAEGNPGRPGNSDLERVATDYDQAIRSYEDYYRRQGAYNTGSIQYDPYSYYYTPSYSQGYQSYRGASYEEQLADAYGQGIAEYEANLQSLEQAQAEFDSSLQYIRGLEGTEREEYIKGWKEYLQGILETSKQLSNAIEESIKSIATGSP